MKLNPNMELRRLEFNRPSDFASPLAAQFSINKDPYYVIVKPSGERVFDAEADVMRMIKK